MDTSFFNNIITLVFWAITAGGFIYVIISAMSLAKAVKAKNSADQEESTYGVGSGFIIVLIGLGGAKYFPTLPTF